VKKKNFNYFPSVLRISFENIVNISSVILIKHKGIKSLEYNIVQKYKLILFPYQQALQLSSSHNAHINRNINNLINFID
jgi:hypothetical protein